MAVVCAQHPDAVATYRCEGCNSLLCESCIKLGHALLLCKLCGERALPVGVGGGGGGDGAQPSTVRELKRREAITKPYSLTEALFYPFRGMGRYLFLATLASMAFVQFIVRFGYGCFPLILWLAFWSLIVGIQFKIVRSTAEGNDELPDWPDYADWGERLWDLAVYLVIVILQVGPAALYTFLGRGKILTAEPSLPFWAGFALLAWLGAAVSVMAYGVAGKFGHGSILRLDLHFRAFRIGGVDAVTVTNLFFGLGILVFLLRIALARVPIVGAAVSGVFGAYWIFTGAHLIGVLFRRHLYAFEELYED